MSKYGKMVRNRELADYTRQSEGAQRKPYDCTIYRTNSVAIAALLSKLVLYLLLGMILKLFLTRKENFY